MQTNSVTFELYYRQYCNKTQRNVNFNWLHILNTNSVVLTTSSTFLVTVTT